MFQIKSLQRKLSRLDFLHILPNYSFFAPRPLENDYRLVFKFIPEEENDWVEVPLYIGITANRFFYNPFKYYNKGMIDCFNFLIAEFNDLENKKLILVSENYLNVLRLIASHVKHNNTVIRFAILTSAGVDEVKVANILFLSAHQRL
ncbi:hypothetical protein [Flavobacterium sp. 3HN19-14]|uniref:hypothetical protein n=1 Tax=Flavobacterium sp. 3HN19-14 TaxID=3448133 RepID=UPI003EE0A42E